MERTPEQQEREINDLLRKSLRASDDSALKRDVLNRLIDLAHSPYSRLKAIASNHLPKYIKACPELEDDGINAVYDLCEDPDREIRIAGYEAIARVSDEEPKFIKRNADVLVQLLQSDEPTEVKVVKKALVRHLEGNAPVTLNVLCDQIAPQDEAMDAEEQATRDNLLSLVVAFIGGDAKKAVTRHAGIAESVLAAGLLVAIPKLNAKEVDIVGRDILMLFPSYQSGSSRNGQVLLQAVLDRAQPILTEELRSTDNSATIPSTLILLKLALYISVDRKVAHPLPLVRFYCSKLVSKLTMSKLDTPTQLNVISGLSQGLTACDADRRQVSAPSDEEIIAVRNQVVDACPLLFERLVESGLTDAESWQTCRLLLKACSQRQKTSAWTSPSHMVTWLRKIQNIADQQAKQTRFESVQEVQSLIRVRNGPSFVLPTYDQQTSLLSLSSHYYR
ncbi:hypothetical protein JAAARDRAFT_37140 [Jaapia argillacea MUCL 33604]|uniref:TATA-binding protein interacting (TIP20) domain-containing protein n=1 Tax=Jaapia argillacea MUCL 33604 TaxID=933084 RepID=A0A067PWQ9_9AGAM|nr:hypothetical protein JAAARDRAFT_37140 [Jaapia argillacea MUCL 33604]